MKNILIVEDERILAISLKMDLNEVGYPNVYTVTNGADAISKIMGEAIDLILMDINIEGEKNGIETATYISTISKVPVIYLTGETDIETKTSALSTENCKGYLSKPVNIKLLEPLLQQALSLTIA